MSDTVVVALGGNALLRACDEPSVAAMLARLRASLGCVAALVRRGRRVILTHGNGPQVGHILIRSEEARGKAYDVPLHVAVAQSQGEIGYLIQQTLHGEGLDVPVATLLTQVVVLPDDPAFVTPTKPVGPFYADDRLLRERHWPFVEISGRGFRRVVPSPKPLRIVESAAVRALFDAGALVVAAGGGGVPVIERGDLLEGIDAVVDKDHSAVLLAGLVDADTLIFLTDVERVQLDFGTPAAHDLAAVEASTLRRHAADRHFAPGSMGPKVEAALDFLDRGGREALITTPESALDARAGTRIVPDREAVSA